MKKKISIIIATFNAELYLEQCIKSIIHQKSDLIELIIIDGKSSDKTVDIIKSNEKHIDFWISEPDNGIYDAWNKGIKHANGDWIMFLGADDQLLPQTINTYIDYIQSTNETYDLISSKIQMIDMRGKKIRIIGYPFRWPNFLISMHIAHPGALHSKKLFETYGIFDTNFKIVGDYELLLRAGAKLKAGFINKVTVIMREGGVSDSINAIFEAHKARVTTGKYNYVLSMLNTSYILSKFILKKLARKIGINVYLKK